MIIGMGNDLIDIRRIEQSLARFGKRFETRVFTKAEQDKAHSRTNSGASIIASSYAKRFAAKEACAKALGTGLQDGVFWHDMEVITLPSGAPSMKLTGGAQKQLEQLVPKGSHAAIHLSLTDEYPYALAHIIIEARPD